MGILEEDTDFFFFFIDQSILVRTKFPAKNLLTSVSSLIELQLSVYTLKSDASSKLVLLLISSISNDNNPKQPKSTVMI